jgi:hypothetical protein
MLTPEELDRVIARAAEAYSAMTPADFRRERRAERRARRHARLARIRAWWRREPAPEFEDAAASFMTTLDTHV